jgi:xanthine/CO dehydrogenase XdhC/CoxF family maturation factor
MDLADLLGRQHAPITGRRDGAQVNRCALQVGRIGDLMAGAPAPPGAGRTGVDRTHVLVEPLRPQRQNGRRIAAVRLDAHRAVLRPGHQQPLAVLAATLRPSVPG